MRSFSPQLLRFVLTQFRIVHELGGLLTTLDLPFDPNMVPAHSMSSVLLHVHEKRISRDGAKKTINLILEGDQRSVDEIVKSENLMASESLEFDYEQSIATLADENPQKVKKLRAGQRGIQQWFVGQLIRQSGKAVDPRTALKAVESFFGN